MQRCSGGRSGAVEMLFVRRNDEGGMVKNREGAVVAVWRAGTVKIKKEGAVLQM